MFKNNSHNCFIFKSFSGYIIRYILPVLFCFCILVDSQAQDKPLRPKVGLVLSGGAAHGIAHLGVLKMMEEVGLRPDYITGVSMGSIIGGLYSIGYSADSLIKIFKTTDWDMMFSNKIPENKVTFLEKDNFHNSILTIPISSKKLIIPSGVINGQQIENMLSYYTWQAADVSDFSELPIPFMCVATDILGYRKIDLRKGYLPDAIRASSAVPSIFTPIKIDSLLLVDGGLLRNFAATEAKEMGADILIGSYTGFQPFTGEELQSVSDIIKQIAFYRSLQDFNEEKKLARILISHKLRNIPKTGFGDVDSLVRRGYEAALPYRETMMQLADSLNLLGSQEPIKNIMGNRTYRFDRIDIIGNHNYSYEQIRGLLDLNVGQDVSREELRDQIELLYGKSLFEKVKYRIIPRNDSLILIIDCQEKPKGNLIGSIFYDNTIKAGMDLGISVKNLFTNNSSASVKALVAQYFRFNINTIQFMNMHQKLGLSIDFAGENTLLPVLEINRNKGSVVSRNYITTIAVNKYIGLNQLIDVAFRFENKYLLPQFDFESHIKKLSYNYATEALDYRLNTLDAKYFPKKGIKLNISASSSRLISSATRTDSSKTIFRTGRSGSFKGERYNSFVADVRYYFPLAHKVTLSIGGNAVYVTSSDSLSSKNNFLLLGGMEPVTYRSIPLAGYHPDEIPVWKMASVTGNLDFELLKDLHIGVIANQAVIKGYKNYDGLSRIGGYGICLGYMSIIGPIRLGMMYGDRTSEEAFSRVKGYISIGFQF